MINFVIFVWFHTRGPEYSRPFQEIVNEAKSLADNGVKEITLLGQNVNAYKYQNFKLSDLILEIEKIQEIKELDTLHLTQEICLRI